jgi:hypothetical protein
MASSVKDLVQTKLRMSNPEKELVDYCNKAYNTARTPRLIFERQWYLNLAFYFGRQYAQWATSALDSAGVVSDVTYSKLYEPAVPPWRVRLISNKIRPIIRGELAKITKEKPRGFILPASTEEQDLTGARAGESIHEFLWRTIGMNRVVRRATFWELLCGTAFIKDWYDKDMNDQTGVKGAICAEPLTPFHLLAPDLHEEELDNQPFVIHVMSKSPDWIKKNFDKEVNPDAGSGGSGILEQKFLTALGLQTSTKNMVSVKEAWIKPNGKFPDGLYCLWAGESILHSHEGWLYKYSRDYEYPFTKLDHIPTGRFYGDSTIVDLMSLQKEYNRTRSQIIEAKNRMAKPQIMAIKGSIDPNRITTEPGLIIQVQPGYAMPTPLPLQNLPSYVIEELNRIQMDMNDISSQHEITKGQTPPGVTAATAISFLQEQDDSKLHTTISSLEEGVERLGRHFLSHVSQFWDMPRTVRVVGANGQFEAYQFTKASLRGNVDYLVEAGSATPVSRAAKQAFITELMKNGWIPPTQGLKYLDMAETGRLYEDMQKNTRHAQRENLKMAQGEQVLINTFDDHLAHVETHEDYCKTEEWENLEEDIKITHQQHITMHKQRYAQMLGYSFVEGDPKLDALVKGMPVAPQQQPGAPQNGSQPQLNGGAPQGGPPQENAIQEPSPT